MIKDILIRGISDKIWQNTNQLYKGYGRRVRNEGYSTFSIWNLQPTPQNWTDDKLLPETEVQPVMTLYPYWVIMWRLYIKGRSRLIPWQLITPELMRMRSRWSMTNDRQRELSRDSSPTSINKKIIIGATPGLSGLPVSPRIVSNLVVSGRDHKY